MSRNPGNSTQLQTAIQPPLGLLESSLVHLQVRECAPGADGVDRFRGAGGGPQLDLALLLTPVGQTPNRARLDRFPQVRKRQRVGDRPGEANGRINDAILEIESRDEYGLLSSRGVGVREDVHHGTVPFRLGRCRGLRRRG